MIDIQDKTYCPSLEEIGEYVNNKAFIQFCADVKSDYACSEKIEFSSCSWNFGWNVKFRKAGKSLCTIYPKEGYFTVLVVVGKKEREAVETVLSELSAGDETAPPAIEKTHGEKSTRQNPDEFWRVLYYNRAQG